MDKSTKPAEMTIPPPRADRPPLHNNVFTAMQKSNTQLMPLFPRLYPGAMVAAGAILRGGPDKSYGHFFHHNTVDEIIVAFAANGSMLKTGQTYVGGRVHGVNSFLKDEKDSESFALMCITQRQSEQEPQHEAVSVQCEKCRETLFRRDFESTPPADADEASHPFVSVAILPEIFGDYNTDPSARTCPACRHVNEPFPVAAWGWDVYADQSATAIEGRAMLDEAADALKSA